MKTFELWFHLVGAKWHKVQTFKSLDAALAELFLYIKNSDFNHVRQWQIVQHGEDFDIIVFSCLIDNSCRTGLRKGGIE